MHCANKHDACACSNSLELKASDFIVQEGEYSTLNTTKCEANVSQIL